MMNNTALPKFSGGMMLKADDFKEGEVSAGKEVAKVIRNHYMTCDYGMAIYTVESCGDVFMFNKDAYNFVSAIDKAKNDINAVCFDKLSWTKEQVEKALHKIYQRLCGVETSGLDFLD